MELDAPTLSAFFYAIVKSPALFVLAVSVGKANEALPLLKMALDV